jgi:hypothetical protein
LVWKDFSTSLGGAVTKQRLRSHKVAGSNPACSKIFLHKVSKNFATLWPHSSKNLYPIKRIIYRVNQRKRTFAFFSEKFSKIFFSKITYKGNHFMREIDCTKISLIGIFEKFSPKNAKVRFFCLTLYNTFMIPEPEITHSIVILKFSK